MPRVRAIIFHEAEADRLQFLSDEHRWIAARLIAEELEVGKSKAQLGREIGKSEAHVRYMARAWETKLKFGLEDARPFNAIYNSPEVRGITAAPTPGDEEWRDLIAKGKRIADELKRQGFLNEHGRATFMIPGTIGEAAAKLNQIGRAEAFARTERIRRMLGEMNEMNAEAMRLGYPRYALIGVYADSWRKFEREAEEKNLDPELVETIRELVYNRQIDFLLRLP